jgi:hypothetical protein
MAVSVISDPKPMAPLLIAATLLGQRGSPAHPGLRPEPPPVVVSVESGATLWQGDLVRYVGKRREALSASPPKRPTRAVAVSPSFRLLADCSWNSGGSQQAAALRVYDLGGKVPRVLLTKRLPAASFPEALAWSGDSLEVLFKGGGGLRWSRAIGAVETTPFGKVISPDRWTWARASVAVRRAALLAAGTHRPKLREDQVIAAFAQSSTTGWSFGPGEARGGFNVMAAERPRDVLVCVRSLSGGSVSVYSATPGGSVRRIWSRRVPGLGYLCWKPDGSGILATVVDRTLPEIPEAKFTTGHEEPNEPYRLVEYSWGSSKPRTVLRSVGARCWTLRPAPSP